MAAASTCVTGATAKSNDLYEVCRVKACSDDFSRNGYAEGALSLVTYSVLLVGLLGMLVSIYTSLNERRREMAILRALGASPRRVITDQQSRLYSNQISQDAVQSMELITGVAPQSTATRARSSSTS
jgi:hypothetical protein